MALSPMTGLFQILENTNEAVHSGVLFSAVSYFLNALSHKDSLDIHKMCFSIGVCMLKAYSQCIRKKSLNLC